MIRQVKTSDAKEMCRIYNYYILNTTVTFDEEPIAEKRMKKRIESVTEEFPWLVYEEGTSLAGYAYLTHWRTRSAYRYSAESTIYLHPEHIGKGIGSLLYQRLIDESKTLSLHSLIGGISLPNNASIALHEKLHFKKVAHFQQVGYKLKQWIDVGYWQLLLQPTT